MCEHYIARGLCVDFPDWTIAEAGCVKIGYEYGRSVAGVENEVEPDLNDEDQILVPDPQEERTMVATSSGVRTVDTNTVVCLMDFCLQSV